MQTQLVLTEKEVIASGHRRYITLRHVHFTNQMTNERAVHLILLAEKGETLRLSDLYEYRFTLPDEYDD